MGSSWRQWPRAVWTRFWHVPVRAERLALTRILLGVALLTDQVFQYLPFLDEFYGPHGVAPAGLHDWWALKKWLWTMLFFHTDNLAVIYPAFALWMAVTFAFTVGWHTRLMAVALWLLTQCFLNRNLNLLNSGDSILQIGLFLLMCSPCGQALSLDALLGRGGGVVGWWGRGRRQSAPATVSPHQRPGTTSPPHHLTTPHLFPRT
jgi:hypothetical protein